MAGSEENFSTENDLFIEKKAKTRFDNIKAEIIKTISESGMYCLFDADSDIQDAKIDNEVDLAILTKMISPEDMKEKREHVKFRAAFESWVVNRLATIEFRYDLNPTSNEEILLASKDGGRLLVLLGMFGYGQDWQRVAKDTLTIPSFPDADDQQYIDEARERSDIGQASPETRMAWKLLWALRDSENFDDYNNSIPEEWFVDMTDLCYDLIKYTSTQAKDTLDITLVNLVEEIADRAVSYNLDIDIQERILTIIMDYHEK